MAKKTSKTKAATVEPQVEVSLTRKAYVLDTLTGEINAAFDGVVYETGDADGWGVIHDLTVHSPNGGDNALLLTLMKMLAGHALLTDVDVDEIAGTATVRVTPNPRTRDSREPLGLDAALAILIETEDGSL